MVHQPRMLTMVMLTLALFLRVWVPAGWMPSASGGAFAIEPCAAVAPMKMAKSDAAHHGPSHKAQHDGDCSFAPHHSGTTSAAPAPAMLAPAAIAAPLFRHVAATFFATGPPAPPPPSTGPPELA